ncbi:hypothetical protein ACFL5V_05735, partial [Fibrobacterota bacterium]
MKQSILLSAFSKKSFEGCFNSKCYSQQKDYLYSYLSVLGAVSFIKENSYVDRHFIQEYQKYYSLNFRQVNNKCKRLHFFKHKITKSRFEAFLLNDEDAIKIFQESYLGFLVIRPIDTKPIGRTVLATVKDAQEEKRFFVTTSYDVHIAGSKLSV